jgi:putative endonuclease
MDRKWFLYIVRCTSGALYTGITIDVKNRVAKHNAGDGARCVKALGLPVDLVYSKEMGSYSAALKEERRVKALSKEEKERLVLKQGFINRYVKGSAERAQEARRQNLVQSFIF